MSGDSNMKIYQFNNFITDKIDKELNEGKYDHVVTKVTPLQKDPDQQELRDSCGPRIANLEKWKVASAELDAKKESL